MNFKKGQIFNVNKNAPKVLPNGRVFRDEMRMKDTVCVCEVISSTTFVGDDGWNWSPEMLEQKNCFLSVE